MRPFPTDIPDRASSLIPSRGPSHRPCPVGCTGLFSHAPQKDSGYFGVAAGERGAANPRVPCGWGCGKLVATGHHKIEHEQECAHREVGFHNLFPVCEDGSSSSCNIVWLLRGATSCACIIRTRSFSQVSTFVTKGTFHSVSETAPTPFTKH